MMNNAHVRRYMREVKKWIPCEGAMKRKTVVRLSEMVKDYYYHTPDADYNQLVQRFGEPKSIALDSVGIMDTEDVLDHLRVRQKLLRIVLATAGVMLALWGGGVLYALVDAITDSGGRMEIIVTVDEVYSEVE